MTDLASLVVRLEAQTAQYMQGMERAQKQLTKFTSAAGALKGIGQIVNAAIGGAVVKAVLSAGKAAIESADKIGNLAQTTGVAVKAMSELAYSASISNIDVETLSKSLVLLNHSALKSAAATQGTADAFSALGISVKDADGQIKSSDQLLLDIAERFASIEDGASKTAIAIDLFGKNGAALIPYLNKGREGIEALHKEAARLGLVLNEQAAKAAGEFNDNLGRLQRSVDGITGQAMQRLLPQLAQLAETFVDIANDGQTLEQIVDGLVTTFKVFATIGATVGTIFQVVGKAIGAVVGALAQFNLNALDFSTPSALMAGLSRNALKADDALAVLKEGFVDIGATVSTNVSSINKLWDDQNDKLQEVIITAKRYKETVDFNPGGGKGSKGDRLEEVSISAQRIDPVKEYYAELQKLTQTDTEKRIAEYEKQLRALDFLYSEGIIKAEQYNARLDEMREDTLGLEEVQITVKKVSEVIKGQTNELTEFQKQAARNTQDIIADTLINGFDDGVRGVLSAFANMLKQMAAQALAAKIGALLFGQNSGAPGATGGGWIGMLLGAMSSRDQGGPGRRGQPYLIGTGAQPEMFIPDQPGRFIPAHQMLGNSTPNVVVQPQILNIRDPSEVPQAIQSGKGEQAILNVIGRNPSTIRNLLQG